MASCEAWLLRQKIISSPFTAQEVAKGALQDYLTQEDYDAPPEGKFSFTASHLQLTSK